MLFWVIPENTLGQSVCRIFYFWLVWLVNLNTGGPLLHCTCFVFTNRINFLNLKESSDRQVIVAKGFLKLPNLHKVINQKSLSLPKNLALGTFGELLIVFSSKVNLLYLLYSMAWRCSACDKAKFFAKNFSKNFNLDDLGISFFFSFISFYLVFFFLELT